MRLYGLAAYLSLLLAIMSLIAPVFSEDTSDSIIVVPVVGYLDPRSLKVIPVSVPRSVGGNCTGLMIMAEKNPLLILYPDISFQFIVERGDTRSIEVLDLSPTIQGLGKYWNSTLVNAYGFIAKGGGVLVDTGGVPRNVSASILYSWRPMRGARGYVLAISYNVRAISRSNTTISVSFTPLGRFWLYTTEGYIVIANTTRGLVMSNNVTKDISIDTILDAPGIVIYQNRTKTAIIIPQQLAGIIATIRKTRTYITLLGAINTTIRSPSNLSLTARGTMYVIIAENVTLNKAIEFAENPWKAVKYITYKPRTKTPLKTETIMSSLIPLMYVSIGVLIGITPLIALYIKKHLETRKHENKLEEKTEKQQKETHK